MKRFLTTAIAKTDRAYGGQNVTVSIYRLKNNKAEYLGEHKYCTRGYKGHESEVASWLVENKYIPKTWTDKGYYHWRNGKFSIQSL